MTTTRKPLSAADAGSLIDNTLTTAVSLIQMGQSHSELTDWIRSGALLQDMSRQWAVEVVAVAVARLGRLHHAIEELADRIDDQGAGPDTSSLLRKLVDDHG